jgi:hypothetical protein
MRPNHLNPTFDQKERAGVTARGMHGFSFYG